MRGWLAALRIARREARRSKWRSALVVALIGLPVGGLSFAAVTFDSFRLTTEQELDRSLGAADALLWWSADGPVTQPVDGFGYTGDPAVAAGAGPEPPAVTGADLLAVLPDGSRVVPLRTSDVDLSTATGIGRLPAEAVDLTDPIHQGRVALREGRAPAVTGEAALTEPAMGRLGATLGETVGNADSSRSWTVVGIVEYPDQLDDAAVVFAPDGMAIEQREWLVAAEAPVSWEQVRQLNRHGIVVQSRAVILDPPPADQTYPEWPDRWQTGAVQGEALALGVVVAGLALLEVVLLAGPAFAVGARRRQRDLALVAANGGTPGHQRRIVLADGIVLGLAGAIAGIGLGVLTAVVALPLVEEYVFGQRAGGLRLWPAALLGIAGLAVLTGLLAALVPAMAAARQNVLAALGGRRGTVRSRKRWVVLGLAMVGLGAAMAGFGARGTNAGAVLAGLVAAQLGLVLCTPALVGLVARAGRFLPLAPRIALRDTARNRAAAAPAISAVMAVVAGSLALGTFLDSGNARVVGQYTSSLPVGATHVSYEHWTDEHSLLGAEQREALHVAMQRTLPVEQVVEVMAPRCPVAGDTECWMDVPVPPQNECPFSPEPDLSQADQRAALADPRCDLNLYVGFFIGPVVDDGTLLTTLHGDAGREAAAALRAGKVVVNDPRQIVDGNVTVELDGAGQRRVTVPAHLLGIEDGDPYTVFVPPDLVTEVGLSPQPVAAVAITSRMPTQAEQDALTAAVQTVRPDVYPYVESGGIGVGSEDPTLLILTIAAGVVMLGATAIATGLAATDRRGDLSTLAAVGASPRVRRLLSLSQSGVIAGLGAVLGTLAGIGGAVAVLVALNRRYATVWPAEEPYPLLVPWTSVLLVAVIVPVVAMVGAGLLTRSRLPIERRLG